MSQVTITIDENKQIIFTPENFNVFDKILNVNGIFGEYKFNIPAIKGKTLSDEIKAGSPVYEISNKIKFSKFEHKH